MMNLTSDQHAAIYTHDRNLIVVAGAGSGKTRVLVERYLALLDAHSDWPLNALVAVTFTRKAAGEMRDRVRNELEKRRQAADAPEARQRWSDLLAALDTARIDTIHGLCATILRVNAAEAGVDPDFAVLEETDARILLDGVIDDVLQALVDERDPAVALFAEYERGTIRAVLANPNLLNAELEDISAELSGRWQADWEREAAEQIDLFKRAAESIGAWQPAAADDRLSENWRLCLARLDGLYERRSLVDYLAYVHEIAAINLAGGSAKAWGGKEVFDEAKSALKAIRDGAKCVQDMIGDPPGDSDRRAAELLPLWTSLLRRVQAAYRSAKESQGLLDFDDLESRTRRLLNDYLHVRARYRNAEFRHILVDEFQDTNAAQWDIIRALADLDTPGSLFVVGDAKQSIYAFRGADVSVFGAVQGQILDVGGQAVPLARSFRTHAPLVNGFNAVFGRLLVQDASSPVMEYEVTLGEPMTAERATPPDEGPVIELLLIDASQSDGRVYAEDARRWEAYEIARRMQDMVARGTMVYDKEARAHRPLQFDDIAILFQSTTQITLYEDVFKVQGLPFVTVAGRGYYSRQEVWDLLNLVRALHNPADNLSLAAALRSPLFSLSDDALLALRLCQDADGEPVRLWDGLNALDDVPADEILQVTFARDCLYELRDLAGRVTIAELLRMALSRTGFLATLTGLPDGARRRGNVEELVDKAQSSGKITLGAFSQYLSDLSARELREGEVTPELRGVVSLMTVHASKGLEFPVVMLADASWKKSGGGGDAVHYDPRYGLTCKVYDASQDRLVRPYSHRRAGTLNDLRDEAERKRLLYVAATRAQDYLLVSGRISRTKEGAVHADGWLGWLWDALEIDHGLERQQDGVIGYEWGALRVMILQQMPTQDMLTAGELDRKTGWDSDAPDDGDRPALLREIVVERDAAARHLGATQIADIGGAVYAEDAHERRFYQGRLRRQLLYDAPASIEQVSERTHPVEGWQIGELVHQALRHWRFPVADADLGSLLYSYAWKQGIIQPDYLDYAVGEARRLLNEFTRSQVYDWVAAARRDGRPVFTELPFIYRTDRRIIHGIIDLLLQRDDGGWALVDYKTAVVRNAAPQAVSDHARRYHLQVGVYAAAVQTQLGGIAPEPYIHYVRHGQIVGIPENVWREALQSLENLIGSVVSDEE